MPEPSRHRHPLAFKRELVQRAGDEHLSVLQLAPQHGLDTNMVFKWRRDLRAGRLDSATALSPVSVTPNALQERSISAGDGTIEIRIGGAVIRIEGAPDPGKLGIILQSLLR